MDLISDSIIWKKLQKHSKKVSSKRIQNLFIHDPHRLEKLSLSAPSLFLDYSKNLIDDVAVDLLCELAAYSKLKTHIKRMFSGEIINNTEKRPVLHAALRAPYQNPHLILNDEDISSLVYGGLKKMEKLVNSLRNKKWRGYSGKIITDIVNIGIGGSDLGPAMVAAALIPYTSPAMNYHFVSNVDATHIAETIKKLNHETTLFIISSKTFTTKETICNACTAKEWLLNGFKNDNEMEVLKNHLVAVTARKERAIDFGVEEKNIYPFWDWVGGRYSLWSSIGLIVAIAIGMENFKLLLQGANEMDEHFKTAPFRNNMPVILALIGIWNINFLHADSQAILPYDQYLSLLPAYLQQLEMESNGKCVSKDGKRINYETSPVIWGASGTNGQHAFHQLLMQGNRFIPADFILMLNSHNPVDEHHMLLVANCLAQSQALMRGKSEDVVIDELLKEGFSKAEAKKLAPHKVIDGNNPSNMIVLQKLTPKSLGSLIALYEHKVFVQGVIWQINSFDQWGVELGKKLADDIVPLLQNERRNHGSFLDQSTENLVNLYKNRNP